jgi:hypothetical protein
MAEIEGRSLFPAFKRPNQAFAQLLQQWLKDLSVPIVGQPSFSYWIRIIDCA